MLFDYLVTKEVLDIPCRPIVMVDGTVPGWSPGSGDLHFDHHRVGGAKIQLHEIGLNFRWDFDPATAPMPMFVTTQVDADACAAAAWIQLTRNDLDPCLRYEIWAKLSAIAYDCDHLGCPLGNEWDSYRDFAANAVAALKIASDSLAIELGLPTNRKEWSDQQDWKRFRSAAFKRGTESLVKAALGQAPWPGQLGEAREYFQKQEILRGQVYARCYEHRGVAVFDQRNLVEYYDARHLVEWARENMLGPVTLTIRNGSRLKNAVKDADFDQYSFTLGSVPLHSWGSPLYCERGIWGELTRYEEAARAELGLPPLSSPWWGRDEVGGSPWNEPSVLTPERVIDCVISCLGPDSYPPFF